MMTSSPSETAFTASPSAGASSTGTRLWSALSRLDAVGISASEDRRVLAAVGEQLAADRFRVLVVGEAKRGKSTLVNALLGRQVLPTGVVPVTALSTSVRAGAREGVSVRLADGREEWHPLQALPGFVTQRANPGNRLGAEEVVVHLDTPRLPAGIELVDTPGTGSVHEHNTEQAQAALKTMDAALFVLSADPPVSAAERDLLADVAAASVRVFVVLNKADLVDEDDLSEAVDYLRAVAGEVLGEPVPVHVCAARPDRQRGVAELHEALGAYLDGNRQADLHRSLARRLRSLTAALLDEVLLARAMTEAEAARQREYRAALHRQVALLGERRQEARDAARAEAERLLDQLNAAAAQASRPLTQRVTQRLAADWPALCAEHAGSELEATGRAHLVALIREAVEPWRAQQEQWLAGQLLALDTRLREGLGRDVGALRAKISDLLGVRPLLEYDGTTLAPNPRFRYHFSEDVGQSELLAGWLRRRLPTPWRHSRAARHLRSEAENLVPMQLGRIRSDLQQRLTETARHLDGSLAARYEAVTRRIRTVLDTDHGEAPRVDPHLALREQLLRQILDDLSEPAADTSAGDLHDPGATEPVPGGPGTRATRCVC